MLALRTERLRRGWSQEEVARRTGIGQATLSKIENGVWPVVYPSWRKRLVKLFKMPGDELFATVSEEAALDGQHPGKS